MAKHVRNSIFHHRVGEVFVCGFNILNTRAIRFYRAKYVFARKGRKGIYRKLTVVRIGSGSHRKRPGSRRPVCETGLWARWVPVRQTPVQTQVAGRPRRHGERVTDLQGSARPRRGRAVRSGSPMPGGSPRPEPSTPPRAHSPPRSPAAPAGPPDDAPSLRTRRGALRPGSGPVRAR